MATAPYGSYATRTRPLLPVIAGVTSRGYAALAIGEWLQLGLRSRAFHGFHGFHGLQHCVVAFMAFMAFMVFMVSSVLMASVTFIAFVAFISFHGLHGFHGSFIIAITD